MAGNDDALNCPMCGRVWEHTEGCPELVLTEVLSARALLAAKANTIASESRRCRARGPSDTRRASYVETHAWPAASAS